MQYMMSKEQQSKRKVINVKGVTRIKGNQFIEELFQAFEEGYVPAPQGSQWTSDAPVLRHNRKTVALYPKGYEVPKPSITSTTGADEDKALIADIDKQIQEEIKAELAASEDVVEVKEDDEIETPSVKSRIEELTKKQPLLDLAKELNVEVPADKKNPAAIKQFLLNTLAE
jgi:hypothetical protein